MKQLSTKVNFKGEGRDLFGNEQTYCVSLFISRASALSFNNTVGGAL